YPSHVTIAVHLTKQLGKGIVYNGLNYSICEPTPQGQDLAIGQIIPGLRNVSFEVAYAYDPAQ
ncbi:MAG: hypothetical protein WKF89_12350, partial [Chitinophagaceae bacterium]